MRKLIFILLLLACTMQVSAQFNPGKYWIAGFIQASDPDSGPEVVYSITAGNSSGYFIIMPCTGIIKVDTLAYTTFTYQKTWTLTIKVADAEGNFVKTTGKIVLKKVNGVKVKPVIVPISNTSA